MRWLVLSFGLLLGCSDLPCTEGTCGPLDPEIVDPDAKTKAVRLACSNDTVFGGVSLLYWDLTVNPGPIVSGEAFGAQFEALARFDEYFLSFAQEGVPGGVTRVNLLDLQATVHVRRGATDPEDVTLTFAPIQGTCRYDGNGKSEFEGGPFPTCSQANDNPDGSNDDCTGLDGVPQPDNPCGQFVDIPISADCAPGGVCDSLGKPFPILPSALSQCETNGFCVTAPAVVALTGQRDGYVAASSGHVLFGWDDTMPWLGLDQTSGPNDGTWIVPPPVFAEPVGPNGMRWIVGDLPIALECTMAVGSLSSFGVQSRNNLTSPAPDHTLISFPIQQPVDPKKGSDP